MNILEIFLKSVKLIISLDPTLFGIIFLSLRVSFTALIISSFFALVLAYFLALKEFIGRNLIIIFFNSLMGIPPVVVGLIVYFIFARGGPFGIFELLYTPFAMIVAQIIIIFPIILSLSYDLFCQNLKEFRDQFLAFNIPFVAKMFILMKKSYFIIITILLSAFGRAISEVGAVMIVGGNIEHYTRVMTTAITLQTRIGNLEYAMALGIVLIVLTMIISASVYIFNLKTNK